MESRIARLQRVARSFLTLALLASVACRAAPPTRVASSAPNGGSAGASDGDQAPRPVVIAGAPESAIFEAQQRRKALDDRIFAELLGDEMLVSKESYSADDGLRIPIYVFSPRDAGTYPVVVLVHGGVHGDFGAGHAAAVRALVGEGYVVAAPEYRGSTGYGKAHFDAIDYGGLEVEDVIGARAHLGRTLPSADTSRVLVMGWSHGGFIALHAVLRRPELFRAAVAHVPVADLLVRMRMHDSRYRAIFAAQRGFGGTVEENPRPYVERSPMAHARRLKRPVLVHTADNDDDVFIEENHSLRDSMAVAGMIANGLYTYREYSNPPGGHSFQWVDSWQARESWIETMAFVRKHLSR
ncbi:MAG TPA: alpha/beta fold hydrolase [Gemmatimonadaceae bacterium]|jgi:dipeptidyl aminopeptidase/acylaminoacyl peptidase|nr:alpha/beta fold hydrolase [Gemmatimonadaceae bacterium]